MAFLSETEKAFQWLSHVKDGTESVQTSAKRAKELIDVKNAKKAEIMRIIDNEASQRQHIFSTWDDESKQKLESLRAAAQTMPTEDEVAVTTVAVQPPPLSIPGISDCFYPALPPSEAGPNEEESKNVVQEGEGEPLQEQSAEVSDEEKSRRAEDAAVRGMINKMAQLVEEINGCEAVITRFSQEIIAARSSALGFGVVGETVRYLVYGHPLQKEFDEAAVRLEECWKELTALQQELYLNFSNSARDLKQKSNAIFQEQEKMKGAVEDVADNVKNILSIVQDVKKTSTLSAAEQLAIRRKTASEKIFWVIGTYEQNPDESRRVLHMLCEEFKGDAAVLEWRHPVLNQSAVFFATLNDSFGLLETLAAAGANINAHCEGGNAVGWTPLTISAWSGFAMTLSVLLKYGADVSLPHKLSKQTAMTLALGTLVSARIKGDDAALVTNATLCVTYLLDAGAHVTADALLLVANQAHVVGDVLLQILVHPNFSSSSLAEGPYSEAGEVGITKAVVSGQVELLKALLRSGANANAPSSSPVNSGLNRARELVQQQQEQQEQQEQQQEGQESLQARVFECFSVLVTTGGARVQHDDLYLAAVAPGLGEYLRLLVSCQPSGVALVRKSSFFSCVPKTAVGESSFLNLYTHPFGGPLHVACKHGNVEAIRVLLEAGADANLHKGVARTTPLILAVTNNQVGAVKEMLREPARVDLTHRDHKGKTVAYLAAQLSYPQVLQVILRAAAAAPSSKKATEKLVDLQDSSGTTPAFAAAMRGNESCLKLLRKAGANLLLPNYEGVSAHKWVNDYVLSNYEIDGAESDSGLDCDGGGGGVPQLGGTVCAGQEDEVPPEDGDIDMRYQVILTLLTAAVKGSEESPTVEVKPGKRGCL